MPEIPLEEQMAALATVRATKLLQLLHADGWDTAVQSLEGCSEEELYDIFDTLLNGTQTVLAAQRRLREQS